MQDASMSSMPSALEVSASSGYRQGEPTVVLDRLAGGCGMISTASNTQPGRQSRVPPFSTPSLPPPQHHYPSHKHRGRDYPQAM